MLGLVGVVLIQILTNYIMKVSCIIFNVNANLMPCSFSNTEHSKK